MEQARDILKEVVQDIRNRAIVSPDCVAMVSSAITTIALLEHEIGRFLAGAKY